MSFRIFLFVMCASLAYRGSSSSAERVSSTVYVGTHFEVRDHDAPVKYVFNAGQRVARVTGSLSPTTRVQRLRLYAGWNAVSLAVNASNAVGQLARVPDSDASGILQALAWNPTVNGFTNPVPGVPLPAGSVLWINAATSYLASVSGAYADPAPAGVPAGGGFVPGAGLEVFAPETQSGVSFWKYDASSKRWRGSLATEFAAAQTPPVIAPGEMVFVHTGVPAQIGMPDEDLRIAYYHPDHLNSASVVTDQKAGVISETAYLPNGSERNTVALQPLDTHYGFTQREQDAESSLHYFGHRYLYGPLGKWLSVDPLREDGGGPNPYLYVNANPLRLHDPDGAEIKITESVKGNTITYKITLKAALIDVSSTKLDQAALAAYAAKVKAHIESSYKGKSDGKIYEFGNSKQPRRMNLKWETSVDLRIVSDYSKVDKSDHLFRIMDETSTSASGETQRGAMLIDIKSGILKRPTPDKFKTTYKSEGLPWEMYHQADSVAAHEFGHSAGLPHHSTDQNLMTDGQKQHYQNIKIKSEQIRTMVESYNAGQLNQRSALEDVKNKR